MQIYILLSLWLISLQISIFCRRGSADTLKFLYLNKQEEGEVSYVCMPTRASLLNRLKTEKSGPHGAIVHTRCRIISSRNSSFVFSKMEEKFDTMDQGQNKDKKC